MVKKEKHLLKSKTVWLNLITMLIMFAGMLGTQNLIKPEYVAAIVGALNIVLRVWFSATPIKLK